MIMMIMMMLMIVGGKGLGLSNGRWRASEQSIDRLIAERKGKRSRKRVQQKSCLLQLTCRKLLQLLALQCLERVHVRFVASAELSRLTVTESRDRNCNCWWHCNQRPLAKVHHPMRRQVLLAIDCTLL